MTPNNPLTDVEAGTTAVAVPDTDTPVTEGGGVPREAVKVNERDLPAGDRSSAPGGKADPDDAPTRTTAADVPVLGSLGVGAGLHTPPDPGEFDEQGRPREAPSTVFAEPDPDAQEASTREREFDPTDRYTRPDEDKGGSGGAGG